MATLNITENYGTDEILTEAQLDAAFASVSLLLNTTKLDEDNFQDNILTTAHIQASAVTTAKILDNAGTDTKLASDASVDANRAITTNHIRDGAVTLDRIVDAAVTRSKQTLNIVTSASSGTFTSASNAVVYITSLSGSITVNASRDVLAMVVPDGSSPYSILCPGTGSESYKISLMRDSTSLGSLVTPLPFATQGNPTPVWIDRGLPAGTYVYAVTAQRTAGSSTIRVNNAKLVLREL